jgi:DNA-binding NarL/FixJ family response regulator
MHRKPALHVIIADTRLRSALLARLGGLADLHMPPHNGDVTSVAEHDVVVATAGDCSAEGVAELARRGVGAVILVALPAGAEAKAYRAAGALDYIPMNVDLHDLVEAIRAALGRKWPSEPTQNVP